MVPNENCSGLRQQPCSLLRERSSLVQCPPKAQQCDSAARHEGKATSGHSSPAISPIVLAFNNTPRTMRREMGGGQNLAPAIAPSAACRQRERQNPTTGSTAQKEHRHLHSL